MGAKFNSYHNYIVLLREISLGIVNYGAWNVHDFAIQTQAKLQNIYSLLS